MNNVPESATHSTRNLLIAAGVFGALILLVFLLWQSSQVLLVIFAGILFAILLDGLADFLRHHLKMAHMPALLLVILVIIALFVGFGWFAGPHVNEQVTQLSERLPDAWERIRAMLEQHKWGNALLRTTPPPSELVPSSADILARISGVFSTALGALVNISIVLVLGFYLALNPKGYLDGLSLLMPKAASNPTHGECNRGRANAVCSGHARLLGSSFGSA